MRQELEAQSAMKGYQLSLKSKARLKANPHKIWQENPWKVEQMCLNEPCALDGVVIHNLLKDKWS